MGVLARMNPGKAMMPGTGEAVMMLCKSLVEVVMLEKMLFPEMGVDGCEEDKAERNWVRREVRGLCLLWCVYNTAKRCAHDDVVCEKR